MSVCVSRGIVWLDAHKLYLLNILLTSTPLSNEAFMIMKPVISPLKNNRICNQLNVLNEGITCHVKKDVHLIQVELVRI